VQDQTGAVLQAAHVLLVSDGSSADSLPVATVDSDASGAFRFDRVPAGSYVIRTEFPGFAASSTRIRVGGRAPSPVIVVMQIEGLTQELSVTTGGQASAEAGANLNAISVDEAALDNMPILDDDVVGALSRFLDASAIGTGGATLLVDGIEVSGLRVTASSIQQVKINQDPYAAEFMRPGRGRIEIVTRPGGREYSGTVNLRLRDSALYARNAFASTTPRQQRRIVDGTIGGPVAGAKATGFTLSMSEDHEDNQANIFARTLDGIVQLNTPSPSQTLRVSGSWNHLQGAKHVQTIRLSHLAERNANQGVGGLNLPDVGVLHEDREDEVTFTEQTVVSPRLLHEFRVLVGDEREPRTSLLHQRRIVVQDAFTGGGAQADTLRTEHHFTLTDAVTWSAGRHTVKFGVNVPDWSWRGFDDRSNTGGTFYFATLDDYAAGRPYSFVEQAGDGRVAFIEKVVAGFVQDEMRVLPNVSLSVGLRYDWQSHFHDTDNLAPRVSFAFAPGGSGRRTVIRGGAGIFYDRTGEGPIRDLVRYDGRHLARYVIVDPGYPDPLPAGQSLAAQPSSTVQLAPDISIPATLQYSAGVERQLASKATLSINFVGSRGYDLFRSRDVNAPAPPTYAARPDPARGVVRQIESAGRLTSAALQITIRGQLSRFVNGSAEYSLGRTDNDTGGINWMPPNAYDLSHEYARADFDTRHRVELFGTFTPGRKINLGVSASLATGRPYSLTTGQDLFNTGTANARPAGVGRNTLTGPRFANVDVRWSKDFAIVRGARTHTLSAGVDAFNVLNRVNHSFYVGNLSSPFFGHAIAAQPPRRIQFSLRVRY
jgi:outer membrane receptor protein involved in Fe transport